MQWQAATVGWGARTAVYYLVVGFYSHFSRWSYLFPLLWLLLQVIKHRQPLRRQLCPYAPLPRPLWFSWVFRRRVQSRAFLHLYPPPHTCLEESLSPESPLNCIFAKTHR